VGQHAFHGEQLSVLERYEWILRRPDDFHTTLAFNFLGDGLRDALDPKIAQTG
jgi:ABC-type dipeptide/oligopeptide/nickel transport system permease subunit